MIGPALPQRGRSSSTRVTNGDSLMAPNPMLAGRRESAGSARMLLPAEQVMRHTLILAMHPTGTK